MKFLKNIINYFHQFKKNKLNILSILIVFLSILIFLIISIHILQVVPLFSDGAFHATIIKEIIHTGSIPEKSPVGWTEPISMPISINPPLRHPPLFYILNAVLGLYIIDVDTTMILMNILPSITLFLTIYILNKLYVTHIINILSVVAVAFSPMLIWNTFHRLIEPTIYFVAVLSVYYLLKNINNPSSKNLILLSLFVSTLFLLKMTLLPLVIVFTVVIFKIYKFKHFIIFYILIIILISPYLQFSIETRGTISYAPPGLPVLDTYLFDPWWNWNRAEWDEKLKIESNEEYLGDRLKSYDLAKRDYFLPKLVYMFDLKSILQYYSIFPVSSKANANWFSPIGKNIYFYFLLIFILGFIYVYKCKFLSGRVGIFYLGLITILLPFYVFMAELRYFFYVPIIFSFISGAGLKCFGKNSTIVRSMSIFIFVIFLSLIIVSEMEHSLKYKDSFKHNLMPQDAGITELIELSREPYIHNTENIFTPNDAEVSYYIGKPAIWDYRLFFIEKGTILEIFKEYNASYLIIPNYMLKEEIYSPLDGDGKNVENIKDNWVGNGIPRDSDFYALLSEGKYFKIVKMFKAFTVYKYESDGKAGEIS